MYLVTCQHITCEYVTILLLFLFKLYILFWKRKTNEQVKLELNLSVLSNTSKPIRTIRIDCLIMKSSQIRYLSLLGSK